MSPLAAMTIVLAGSTAGAYVGFVFPVIFIVALITCFSSYLVMRGTVLLFGVRFPMEITIMNASMSEVNNMLRLGVLFYVFLLWFLMMWAA